jgi:arsenite methyltransferase
MARVIGAAGTLVIGLGDPDAMASMAVTSHGFRLRPIAEVLDGIGRAGLNVTGHEWVGDDDGAFHLLAARRRAAANSA